MKNFPSPHGGFSLSSYFSGARSALRKGAQIHAILCVLTALSAIEVIEARVQRRNALLAFFQL
jgi:hypothetical protein